MKPPAWRLGGLLLVLLLLAQPADGAGRIAVDGAYWGTAATREEASPGDFAATLTVSLRNAGLHPLTDLEAALVLPRGLVAAREGSSEARLGFLPPGQAWQAEFVVDLDDDLAVGDELAVPVRVASRAVEDTLTNRLGPRTTDSDEVTVRVPGRATLAVDASIATLPAGDATVLDLRIGNVGDGRAATLEVEVLAAPGSGLLVDAPTAPVAVPLLAPGDVARVPVRVLAPPLEGLHALAATIAYVDAADAPAIRTQTVPFTVLADPAGPFRATLAQTRLAAGRVQTLDLRLDNEGRVPAASVVVSLAASPPAGGPAPIVALNASDVVRIGDLAAGERADVQVPVAVSEAALGTHALVVDVTWLDPAGIGHRRSFTFGVLVEGVVDLVLDELCASHEPDGRLAVGGLVTNLGNARAHNADVRVEAAQDVEASEREDLGDVDPNDSFSFEVETRASGDAAPETLTLAFFWTEEAGRNGTRTVDVPVAAAGPACFEPPAPRDATRGVPAASVLAVVAAALAVALRRRRP